MNVLFVCNVYPPEHAPAGLMVRELAEDLSAMGWRITVLTGWPNRHQNVLFSRWWASLHHVERDPAGFTIIRCGHSFGPRNTISGRIWYYLTFSLSTLVIGLTAGQFDAVLCLSTPIFGSWSSWFLAKLKRARFVYDIFDLHPEAAQNVGLIDDGYIFRILRATDTVLCRHSDVILSLSENMKNSILARGILPERVRIAPFWIDANKIRPMPHQNPWRQKVGVSHEAFVCLYAGTMGFISGIEMLADTARQIIDRKDIIMLCVGEGVAKQTLQKRAADLGLMNITFLPFQPANQLCDMLATADIGMVTLLPDAGKSSNPSKVLGYIAAGRPVLASVSDDSDTARIIREGKCGWVVPCQDSVAMAEAIRHAADNRKDTQDAGRRAREYFLSNFSRKVCIDIYQRALEGH